MKLIIVGAGTAGLSAGCYAAMNGYAVTLLEKGLTPGGLCTSWQRAGYLFDGSVAGLAGAGPGSPLERLWSELGVLTGCPLTYREDFGRIHLPGGRIVTAYADPDRLCGHLAALFPDDRPLVDAFCTALRASLRLDIPLSDHGGLRGLRDMAAAALAEAPAWLSVLRTGARSIQDFCRQAQDPELALALTHFVHFGSPDAPLLTLLLPLAHTHRCLAGIPQGGWLDFARAMERRFTGLGGRIRYGTAAARLVTENGRAAGVRLTDGEVLAADRVMMAADGYFAQTAFLGRLAPDDRALADPNRISEQPVQVNLGAWAPFDEAGFPSTHFLKTPMEAAGRLQGHLTVNCRRQNPLRAENGRYALTVYLKSDYAWWQGLLEDPGRYEAEKARCAAAVTEALVRWYPQLQGAVEVAEVSTPLTRERHTGNRLGAMQGKRPDSRIVSALLQGDRYADRHIPGYYHAGQWAEPWGGITTAALSGRRAVQTLCRKDLIAFCSSVPH